MIFFRLKGIKLVGEENLILQFRPIIQKIGAYVHILEIIF